MSETELKKPILLKDCVDRAITVEDAEKQIAQVIQTCFIARNEMHKADPNCKPASKTLFAEIIAEKIMEQLFGVEHD